MYKWLSYPSKAKTIFLCSSILFCMIFPYIQIQGQSSLSCQPDKKEVFLPTFLYYIRTLLEHAEKRQNENNTCNRFYLNVEEACLMYEKIIDEFNSGLLSSYTPIKEKFFSIKVAYGNPCEIKKMCCPLHFFKVLFLIFLIL